MMGYLGRYQQGQDIPLTLICTDPSDTPADPGAGPAVAVYRDGSPPTRVEVVEVPADLRGVQAGFFRMPLFLGTLYATPGRYLVVYRWATAGGVARTRVGSFTLLPGGSADGAVVALRYAERPDARFLVYQTDAGTLARGRNPR